MSLISLKQLYYSVAEFPLLDSVNFEIKPRERIAIIGRNGEGKSTLLNMLSGNIEPQSGDIIKDKEVHVAQLAQALPLSEDITVYEAVAKGLAQISELLIEYHQLLSKDSSHDEAWLADLSRLQTQIEALGGWQLHHRIEKIIDILTLPAEALMSSLSGGWRKRVALAQAMVQEPEVLLLDEPTNHLDLEAIQWLEKAMLSYPKSILFITHDRALLRAVATRIVELDRGKLTSYPSDYDAYLIKKQQLLDIEERQAALFDKKLSEEEQWLRQGVKARRTRNEGRVRALMALREERKRRRERKETPNFVANENVQAGKSVIQAQQLCFGYEGKDNLIEDFTFTIQRGDKIAIIGPNGAGKTTLVKLLLGQISPQAGSIKHSPTNSLAFFDQNREQLKLDESLIDNVATGDDFVETQGRRKHIIGYLGDFLFSPKKCRAKAKTLSGGEQNRLMLAKLFSKPANLLVLDEPTNDLDIESLDMLESLLLGFKGTVILISHDREFIDNIATHCIAFDEQGKIDINVGGYSDWLARKKSVPQKPVKKAKQKPLERQPSKTKTKLSFNEQQELSKLPALIEALEIKIEALQKQLSHPDAYQSEQADVSTLAQALREQEHALEKAFQRWDELESLK